MIIRTFNPFVELALPVADASIDAKIEISTIK